MFKLLYQSAMAHALLVINCGIQIKFSIIWCFVILVYLQNNIDCKWSEFKIKKKRMYVTLASCEIGAVTF